MSMLMPGLPVSRPSSARGMMTCHVTNSRRANRLTDARCETYTTLRTFIRNALNWITELPHLRRNPAVLDDKNYVPT